MKKLTAMFLMVMLVVGLAACGNQQQEEESNAPKSSSEAEDERVSEPEIAEEASEPSSADETEVAGDGANEQTSSAESTNNEGEISDAAGQTEGKTLVVYYSASGNTEEVANYIAAATGGDVFELEPVEPYTDADLDWTDEDSRVYREHENEEERNVELVSETVSDWDSYETVFIGYPIWWGIAAWPVNGFITANDFTGKTVIPFCTSASSGLGESTELLSELAGTGNWMEGERFQSGAAEEDVKSWVNTLGL